MLPSLDTILPVEYWIRSSYNLVSETLLSKALSIQWSILVNKIIICFPRLYRLDIDGLLVTVLLLIMNFGERLGALLFDACSLPGALVLMDVLVCPPLTVLVWFLHQEVAGSTVAGSEIFQIIPNWITNTTLPEQSIYWTKEEGSKTCIVSHNISPAGDRIISRS